jgi:hypothetical protein
MRAVAYASLLLGITLLVLPRRLAPGSQQSVGDLEYPFCPSCEPGVMRDDDERSAVRG